MGRRPPKRDERCRRHPEHRQSKGVCPSCLREALANLQASSSSQACSTASSSAYSSDSDLSSSAASTPPYHDRSTGAAWLSLFGCILNDSRAFSKTREQEEDREQEQEERKEKKKGRFWFKLLGGSRRLREDGGSLLHSKTVKENASAKWISVQQ